MKSASRTNAKVEAWPFPLTKPTWERDSFPPSLPLLLLYNPAMPSTLPPPPPSHHHLPSTAKTPSSPLPSSSNSRPDSQAQWARLLEQYANGEAALDRLVVDPPFDLLEPATEEDERIVETAEKGSAEYCRSFYRREGYLPAPANRTSRPLLSSLVLADLFRLFRPFPPAYPCPSSLRTALQLARKSGSRLCIVMDYIAQRSASSLP